MTKSMVQKALDDLGVAAAVCELDENATVIRQAVRIRSARNVLAQAIEAQRAAAVEQDAVYESLVPEGNAP